MNLCLNESKISVQQNIHCITDQKLFIGRHKLGSNIAAAAHVKSLACYLADDSKNSNLPIWLCPGLQCARDDNAKTLKFSVQGTSQYMLHESL